MHHLAGRAPVHAPALAPGFQKLAARAIRQLSQQHLKAVCAATGPSTIVSLVQPPSVAAPPSASVHTFKPAARLGGQTNMELPSVSPSLLSIQNMVQLCKELKLPVSYKVHEVGGSGRPGQHTYLVVVQAHHDYAFKKYLEACAATDLMFYRGLLLTVTTAKPLDEVIDARVQQAFLPKFENEGQDSSIADAIVQQAHERFMVVTIKHSGSLVTLSADGFAAKNSINNEYTAGAATLLRAHFDRLHGPQEGPRRLAAFMQLLRERKLAVSFEMVTGCHGHHGQLPAGEYLVATAAHVHDDQAGRPVFLGWLDFLNFCLEQGLPVNDTWLFAGAQWASAARGLLDDLALAGGVTGYALQQLNQLVQDGTEAGCLHVLGTYPHDQWQGSRIEGFVVAQGQAYEPTLHQALVQLTHKAGTQSVQLGATPESLRTPYKHVVAQLKTAAVHAKANRAAAHAGPGHAPQGSSQPSQVPQNGAAAGGDTAVDGPLSEDMKIQVLGRITSEQAGWLPARTTQHVPPKEATKLIEALLNVQAPGPVVKLPNGELLFSRAALAHSEAQQVQHALEAAVRALTQAGRKPAEPAAVQQLMQALQSGDKSLKLSSIRVRAPRALMGAPDLGNTLRYKKKMVLWRVPRAAPAARSNSVAPMDVDGASPPFSPSPGADAGVGVGYCMMTFILRNGLASLKLGLAQYLGYVSHQARNWGLSEPQVAQVLMFARAWAAWVTRHGGVSAVKESHYLQWAEPFVQHFLACMSAGDMASLMGQRPQDAFNGILLLLDEPSKELAEKVQRALSADAFLEVENNKTKVPPFGKSLVVGGMVVWLKPEVPLPNDVLELLKGAGPSAFVGIAQKQGASSGVDAKRARGISDVNKNKLEGLLKSINVAGSSAPTLPRLKLLPYGYSAQDVVGWLGRGVPLPQNDPAAICCFVSIPGVGKTVLTDGLAQLPGLSDSKTRLNVQVLNSDKMKKQKGFVANRYWNYVAHTADSTAGGCTVVVADKNLVPSPPGNIQKVAGVLKDSGAVTVAVVPSWRGTPQWDVGVPYPQVPWPLELVALCMLRTLLRKNHEGQLDAQLATALRVVTFFATFYKNKSYADVLELCRSQFVVVAELPVINLDANDPSKQVPLELLQHIAWGIANLNERTRKGEDELLPKEWEAKARKLLLHPATMQRLQSLQAPMQESQQSLGDALLRGLKEAQELAAGGASTSGPVAGGAGASAAGQAAVATAMAPAAGADNPARVRYIAVAGVDGEAIKAAAQALLPDLDLRKVKTEFHVTLWHAADPIMGKDHGMRDALLAERGRRVELQVTSLDCLPGKMVAAQVELLDAPEAAFSKPYHHITLHVGQGMLAKDANKLPDWVEAGTAQRVVLEEPLILNGHVAGFS